MSNPLIEAVNSQNVCRVKELLALEFDPNTKPTKMSGAVLEIATSLGNIEITKLLIEAGADVNETDCEGGSPLMVACHYNKNVEIVKMLLSAGADINAVTKDGETALMGASSEGHCQVIKTLLLARANPHLADKNNMTALEKAALAGKIEAVKILIQVEDLEHYRIERAATWARAVGHLKIVKLLQSQNFE